IFGYEPYAYNLGTKYKVNCNSVMAYVLIKTFPELEGKNIMKIPTEFVGDFLRGFFDADGNVHLRPKGKTKIKGILTNSNGTPRVKFTLGNERLINWVSDLLHKLDIVNKINKGKVKLNGKIFNCWTILISGRDKIDKYAYLVGFDSFKENILYRGLKCDSPKYQILKNSAEISLFLYKDNLKIEEILEKTGLSRYQVIMALKRMYNLKIISKKRYTNRNKWIYSLSKTNNEFLFHCMKLVYNKINENIYEIPLRKLSNLNYQDYVYDLSVDKKSPNFITDGFILVHNSTRANILETLYNRNYIKDKQIKATELGIRLIDSLRKHSPIIIDEELTRNIEKDMDSIRNSKKELDKKEREVINKAEEALKDISKDFKKKEGEIGKELVEANQALWDGEKENNKLDVECPSCKTGRLALKYTPRFKSYFVACDNYPKCKQTYSLPKALIKNTAKKNCEECSWPMLLSIKKARKPWVFCFNPECPSKRPLDINGDDKKPEERYVGNPADVHRKKIADIERVDGSQKI
ncbi:hypothetical protein CMI42_05840, partial [Candidatus Pacearchaeota archaeon]|nr:hypothetical protein [Candidatus Pacearchaeota archaeon]